MNPLGEPLEESAPIAWRLASQLCRKGPPVEEDCSWCHGVWQTLRLLGLVTSPSYHAEFYASAFASVESGAGAPRVLVSGAADYGMLACVLAAFRGRGREPAITMLDVCETPLALGHWYAERAACRIDTFRGDILDYEGPGGFDAVCSDSFLGRFTPDARVHLLEKWRDLLRPGGAAITVVRLRPGSSGERVGFSAEQARSFAAATLREAGAMKASLPFAPHEIAERAAGYAIRHFTYSIGSAGEVRDLFERCGFRVEALRSASVAAGNRLAASGPSVRSGADYAKIVAIRA
jgi:SAM-dependent methyltransferase